MLCHSHRLYAPKQQTKLPRSLMAHFALCQRPRRRAFIASRFRCLYPQGCKRARPSCSKLPWPTGYIAKQFTIATRKRNEIATPQFGRRQGAGLGKKAASVKLEQNRARTWEQDLCRDVWLPRERLLKLALAERDIPIGVSTFRRSRSIRIVRLLRSFQTVPAGCLYSPTTRAT